MAVPAQPHCSRPYPLWYHHHHHHHHHHPHLHCFANWSVKMVFHCFNLLLLISETEHLFLVHVIPLLSSDCSRLLPIFLLLLYNELIWRSFYYDRVFIISLLSVWGALSLSLILVLCCLYCKHFFKHFKTEKRSLQKSLARETGTNPEKKRYRR